MPDALRCFLPLILCLSCVSTTRAQPAPSTIEGSPVSAGILDAERAASDAYWRDVAEGLLQGQARPDRCPQEANATRCLLAARLLLVSRDHSSDEPPEEPAARVLKSRIAGLARDAAARDPRDPQLQWTLAKGVFREFAPELQAPAIEALRTREPDNLQVWLLASDFEAWNAQRLAAAAATVRSDSYRYDFMRADLGLLAPFAVDAPRLGGIDWEASGVESQQVYLIGVATAEWMPGLEGLMQACRSAAESAVHAERHSCWRIAELLVERSDSLMEFGLGASLMRIAAFTNAQRERAEAARHEYAWLGGTSVELQQAAGGAREHLRRLREPGVDELGAAREAMREVGLPLSPPLRESGDPS